MSIHPMTDVVMDWSIVAEGSSLKVRTNDSKQVYDGKSDNSEFVTPDDVTAINLCDDTV
jgi:hypothetical protein